MPNELQSIQSKSSALAEVRYFNDLVFYYSIFFIVGGFIGVSTVMSSCNRMWRGDFHDGSILTVLLLLDFVFSIFIAVEFFQIVKIFNENGLVKDTPTQAMYKFWGMFILGFGFLIYLFYFRSLGNQFLKKHANLQS